MGQTPFKVVVVLDMGLPEKVGDDGEQRPSAVGWGTDCTSNCYHLRPILPPVMWAVPAGLTTARGAPTPPGDGSISLLSGFCCKASPQHSEGTHLCQQFIFIGRSYISTDTGSLLDTVASLFSPAQV